ncbi:MAG: 1-acyl-sn-glycerol-3-phosphate acyltransferase [Bacteroidales bacterium]|nr:1-acyl-sn-glycerol-3-phosphate acyltransferase [Bacteroidales bacterium]
MAKSIQDNNTLYNILSPLVQFGTRCHYQRFDVRGLENLPTNGAYIIAPCHQQALMEPLAVLNFAPKPPVFLARADIFQKPLFRAILTFLKILPVYRIRDGQSNLSKNNDIFDRSRDVLLDGFPLCLMAEGRHNDRHHLLPMGKGMFRIAGETQVKLGDHPLYIVPTGIDFDEYERPYSNLVVNIGKPIPVQPFMDDFKNNEPVALNEMRVALATELSPLMHDIRNEEYYEEIFTLCNVLNRMMRKREGLKNSAWNRFLMRQKISLNLDKRSAEKDEKFDTLISQTRSYQQRCKRLHLRERAVPDHWSLPTLLLALLPLVLLVAGVCCLPAVRWIFLFWLVCYPIPFIPTHLITRKLIADSQFRSSVNFGIRFVLSIIYCIVIGIVMSCTGGMWMSRLIDLGVWWGLIAVAVVHLGAILAGPTVNALKAIGRNLRYWWLRIVRFREMKELEETYKKLTELF